VTNKSTAQLRLHTEQADDQPGVAATEMDALCRAFETATGWELGYETSALGFGETWATQVEGGGRLVLRQPESHLCEANCDGKGRPEARLTGRNAYPTNVRPLALEIAGLLGEINRLRRAVWQREAELAAGVPVAARANDELHLAERLEAVLKSGAESLGCQAAGLYLLDDSTSELKLRAMWNLPEERLLAPARPLRGSMADLEALVGHAVVLEDTSLMPHWRCPEDFPSAACVPVSSPSVPLGTLWIFSNQPRDFSAEQTSLLEIIAGRLAADLEREMLLAAGTKSKQRDQQIDVVKQWQRERLPSVTPLIEDYEIAGWTEQADDVGGDFHDWSVLADGRLALAVGDAEGTLLSSALSAATLQSNVKAHAAYRHTAAQLLTRVNESLVAASPGDQQASLAYALIEPDSGLITLGLAGACAAFVVGIESQEATMTDAPPLGQAAELEYGEDRAKLGRGEVLVLASSGVLQGVDSAGLRIGEAVLCSSVAKHLADSADGIAARIRGLLLHGGQVATDMTVLVVKRRG
jgi:sigma-B regulation protein RsbU (phosphoserine phosphatase)